jgi:hypothetical protein
MTGVPMPSALIRPRWRARQTPLRAAVCLAHGDPARLLGRRLLAASDEVLSALRACVASGLIAVVADEASLPWVDGASYLGHDPAAPALLLPTNTAPDVPLDLFAAALGARLPGVGAPWAVLPGGDGRLTVVSLAAAGPIARAELLAWTSGPAPAPC